MYIVINSFRDKQDNNRLYKKGEAYPAEGVKVSKARLNFLCKENPGTGAVYLKEVADTPNEGEGLTGEGGGTGED